MAEAQNDVKTGVHTGLRFYIDPAFLDRLSNNQAQILCSLSFTLKKNLLSLETTEKISL